jgi:hypothetical protein
MLSLSVRGPRGSSSDLRRLVQAEEARQKEEEARKKKEEEDRKQAEAEAKKREEERVRRRAEELRSLQEQSTRDAPALARRNYELWTMEEAVAKHKDWERFLQCNPLPDSSLLSLPKPAVLPPALLVTTAAPAPAASALSSTTTLLTGTIGAGGSGGVPPPLHLNQTTNGLAPLAVPGSSPSHAAAAAGSGGGPGLGLTVSITRPSVVGTAGTTATTAPAAAAATAAVAPATHVHVFGSATVPTGHIKVPPSFGAPPGLTSSAFAVTSMAAVPSGRFGRRSYPSPSLFRII